MDRSARCYFCHRCGELTIICSHCDRGNIYCSSKCSEDSRRDSVRASSQRYQKSWRGRSNHAKRQSYYRQHKKEKVTHQGSVGTVISGVLAPTLTETEVIKEPARQYIDLRCHFCGEHCMAFLRTSYLHSRVRKDIARIRQGVP